MSSKHWLFAFEGLRGLIYVSGIVSIIAPSLIAFYLLSPQELLRMPWPAAVLISASVGGISALSAIIAVIIGGDHEVPGDDYGIKIEPNVARVHLAVGPLCGLVDQCLALGYGLMFDRSFHEYIQTALLIAGAGSLLLYGTASFHRWRQKKNSKSAPAV